MNGICAQMVSILEPYCSCTLDNQSVAVLLELTRIGGLEQGQFFGDLRTRLSGVAVDGLDDQPG